MQIYQVTAVVVVKFEKQLIVQATGLTTSTGWTNPRLVADDPNPADKVLEFSFEADRPGGITLPVLSPISASLTLDATDAEAVIVKSRTNSITVHASEFQDVSLLPTPGRPGPVTTLAIGEEGPPFSTQRFGEEHPPLTTLALGEEGPFSTFRFGEEGPLGTDPRVDDPIGSPLANSGLTTLALGEEGGGGAIDPRFFGQGTPFGGF